MRGLDTRRRFVGHVGSALAGCTIAGALPLHANDGTTQPPSEGEDYYAKLGVTKIINAAGTYTHPGWNLISARSAPRTGNWDISP